MSESFLNGRVILHSGNCLDVLARMAECSVDSCVTDPPYHLTSIVKRFANSKMESEPFAEKNPSRQFGALSRGFMGKQWDGGNIAFDSATWCAVYRVLKPGGHLLAMGGTRTFHRLACAIEDAGFEIRDTISWLYGSGFPKSHDVSKGIDRAVGAEREVVGNGRSGKREAYNGQNAGRSKDFLAGEYDFTAPATDAARQWEGWGTALKPACELIVLARKPLSEGTVAANVLRWGTGAINVDGCRVEAAADYHDLDVTQGGNHRHDVGLTGKTRHTEFKPGNGRWPANVAHDGSDEVTAAFPDAKSRGEYTDSQDIPATPKQLFGNAIGVNDRNNSYANEIGSAARFFYTSKADADDRLGSKHPTVKPLDLMQWLVRMVTPKSGTVLDPFSGTGTTGEAAWREGMRAVLIEAEAEYQADIRRRMALALVGPDERSRESIRAKNLPVDYGPLFGFREAAE